MTSKPSPTVHVVKKEEKEAKLRAFLQRRISAATTGGPEAGVVCLKIIARSFDSPAVKALAAEAAAQGVLVDAIVIKHTDGESEGARELATALGGKVRCRVVSDTRLLDAHEQIIIDSSSVWIGDCMRRDPQKRDAFERYAENAADTAAWALTCFDRLWRAAEALAIAPPVIAASSPYEVPHDQQIPAAGEIPQDGEIEVLTRH